MAFWWSQHNFFRLDTTSSLQKIASSHYYCQWANHNFITLWIRNNSNLKQRKYIMIMIIILSIISYKTGRCVLNISGFQYIYCATGFHKPSNWNIIPIGSKCLIILNYSTKCLISILKMKELAKFCNWFVLKLYWIYQNIVIK